MCNITSEKYITDEGFSVSINAKVAELAKPEPINLRFIKLILKSLLNAVFFNRSNFSKVA